MDKPIINSIHKTMSKNQAITIIGGGHTGAVLALALAHYGRKVTLIGRLPDATDNSRSEPQTDARSYAMSLSSQRLLKALGIWDLLKEHAQEMTEIQVSDGHAGNGAAPWTLEFDTETIGGGAMGYMVPDSAFSDALRSILETKTGITHIAKPPLRSIERAEDRLKLEFEDDTHHFCSLLLGADGRNSRVAQIAGIDLFRKDYHQTAIVCAIAHEKPHHGIAHQFFMPHGPIAILPLKGNLSSIVWTETRDAAQQLLSLSDEAFIETLKPRFGSFLGELRLAAARQSFPLKLSMAHSYTKPGIAILGDAAHAIHPIAGQGLNAGLRDAAALAQILSQAHRNGEDIASLQVLKRYERWRRFENTALALATDSFNVIFSNDNIIMRPLRDVGMSLFGKLPTLRKSAIMQATGTSGPLPELMQTE